MEDFYVLEQGCVIKKFDQQFLVTKGGIKIISIPAYKVDKIILFGNQQITSQALSLAFENNIDVLFVSTKGRLKGKIYPNISKNVYLRFAQYESWRDKERRLKLSKIFVKGKIVNQQKLLKRYKFYDERLESLLSSVERAKDNDELLGIEGLASKYYFQKLKDVVPKDYTFDGRSRRPPKDEVNSLLSLTYSMVLNEIISQVERSGLDSYIGFLHSIKYGRQSLPLDLLEEFRQYFCDLFVIKLLNRQEITMLDFYCEENGIFLKENSLRKYIFKFNNEMEKIKPVIQKQVNLLKNCFIRGEEYMPVILR